MRHTGFLLVDGGQRDPRDLGRHTFSETKLSSPSSELWLGIHGRHLCAWAPDNCNYNVYMINSIRMDRWDYFLHQKVLHSKIKIVFRSKKLLKKEKKMLKTFIFLYLALILKF